MAALSPGGVWTVKFLSSPVTKNSYLESGDLAVYGDNLYLIANMIEESVMTFKFEGYPYIATDVYGVAVYVGDVPISVYCYSNPRTLEGDKVTVLWRLRAGGNNGNS